MSDEPDWLPPAHWEREARELWQILAADEAWHPALTRKQAELAAGVMRVIQAVDDLDGMAVARVLFVAYLAAIRPTDDLPPDAPQLLALLVKLAHDHHKELRQRRYGTINHPPPWGLPSER